MAGWTAGGGQLYCVPGARRSAFSGEPAAANSFRHCLDAADLGTLAAVTDDPVTDGPMTDGPVTDGAEGDAALSDAAATDDEHLKAVRERFDGRAPTYDESAMHRDLAAAVAAFADLTGVNAVLDVATGTGLVLRALRDRGYTGSATGVDLSPRMLAEARLHLPDAELLEADATRLPLDAGTFDLVTCVTGLQLFPHPVAAVAEWARVLRPTGRAVTATFLAFDPSRHRAAPPQGFIDHTPFDSVENLADTVAPAGFRVVRTDTWTDGADEVLIAELAPLAR